MAGMTGQCHCGELKYEAAGPVVKCSYCDCRGCQRATGTLRAPFVTVAAAGFKVVAGVVAKFRAAAGDRCDAHGVWHWCAKCGSPVFWQVPEGQDVDVFAGTLDDTGVFAVKE